MPTIKFIAKKAGVSPTTVTNVLHGNYARVSEATRQKVETYLKKYNYAPNMGAMILAQNDSRIIGVIMFMEPRWNETVLEDPFSSAILGAMEEEIRAMGYFFMLHTTTKKEEVVRLAKTWKLAGLILVWVPKNIGPIILDSVESPVVFIDSHLSENEEKYHSVGLKDEEGGYLISRHLVEMGHRHVIFLANDTLFSGTDLHRFRGCQRAFKEQDIDISLEDKILLSKERKERYKTYSKLASKEMPYTALIFSSDYYAAEAVSYLQDCNIRVPEDISITGFDDNIFSRMIHPHLTTIHQNSSDKGRIAVAMLMKLIKKQKIEQPNIQLDVELVVRNSVKDLRN